MPYKVNSIRPRGSAAIELGQLTVLVGPNNCGKSQTLKDIRQFTSSGSDTRLVVLDQILIQLPDEGEIKRELSIRPNENTADHVSISGVKDDLLTQLSFGPHDKWLEQTCAVADQQRKKREVLQHLGTCLVAYLGAEARFKLTTGSAGFNPRAEFPSNAIQSLLSSLSSDKSVHEELRKAFRSAFNKDIAFDWGAFTRLSLRVADDFGVIPGEREALDALMENAVELEKQGDGFRSFAGIALALLTYPTRVLLLDEPEAFLHPAQARALGRWVGATAAKRPGQVIVATHSADFLAGLVGANNQAKILRLNRDESVTRFHQIPHSVTTSLLESPLLSSQPVLDSLFHRGVIVCEGDPDRAVYQTVAQRFHLGRSAEEFLFIHSNGKDAARLPASLFHESGTPVCVVADFDVLNSEKTLGEIIEGLTGQGLDEETKRDRDAVSAAIESKSQNQSFEELKASVLAWTEQSGDDLRQARRSLISCARAGTNKWDLAKKQGLSGLAGQDADRADNLLERLARNGLFVVPYGELESWMALQHPKGNKWNQAALQELHAGNCPEELKSFVGRVLAFLGLADEHPSSLESPSADQIDSCVADVA